MSNENRAEALFNLRIQLANALGLKDISRLLGFDLRVRADDIPRLTAQYHVIEKSELQTITQCFKLEPITNEHHVETTSPVDQAASEVTMPDETSSDSEIKVKVAPDGDLYIKAIVSIDTTTTAAQPASEPMVRYCPDCGTIGDVPATARDCCPDGMHARMVPANFAQLCRATFMRAIEPPKQPSSTDHMPDAKKMVQGEPSTHDAANKVGPVWEAFLGVYDAICNRPITIREIAWRCFLAAQPAPVQDPMHPDDLAVDLFAAAQPAKQEQDEAVGDCKRVECMGSNGCIDLCWQKKTTPQPKQERPQNCGTGHCSCIECVMESKHKALTDEECDDLWDMQLIHITDKVSARQFIRDVEAAHGIKDKP